VEGDCGCASDLLDDELFVLILAFSSSASACNDRNSMLLTYYPCSVITCYCPITLLPLTRPAIRGSDVFDERGGSAKRFKDHLDL